MCRPATCRTCGKTTWAGCGSHVDQVMSGVPKNDRCTCDRSAGRPAAKAKAGTDGAPSGWLRRLIGR